MAHLVTKATALANKLATQARPHLEEFWKYAKVELDPPMPGDFAAIKKTMSQAKNEAKKKSFGSITVREAWLNTLVTVEVSMWFFMGECIGRRHFVGYKV